MNEDIIAQVDELLKDIDLLSNDKLIAKQNLRKMDNIIDRLAEENEFLRLGAQEEDLQRLISLNTFKK